MYIVYVIYDISYIEKIYIYTYIYIYIHVIDTIFDIDTYYIIYIYIYIYYIIQLSYIYGISQFVFMVLSGVLQGCPLSGTLFVIVMDPIMCLFSKYICQPDYGQVRACADDVGSALHHLKDLIRIYLIFEQARKATGLTLKPNKCVSIMESHLDTDHNIGCVRAWLRANIPAWDIFLISNHGKYLGFFIGPNAGLLQWAAPIAKFTDRCNNLYNDRMLHWLALREYVSKASSVLLYVGQLALPPKNLKALEARSVSKLLGFATNSLCFDFVFSLDYFECLRFPRPSYSICTARIRACAKTLIPAYNLPGGGLSHSANG